MIRVLIADDQTLVRSGIRGLLELTGEIAVVGEASDGAEALRMVADLRPDVLLLDVRMPQLTGVEVLARLREQGQLPPAILLTTFDDDEALLAGMRAGARGFLLKDISMARLTDAIRRVAAGGTLFRPAVTERVLQALSNPVAGLEPVGQPERLSARELDVLGLMAAGFNNKEIGDALALSEGTVKNHISSILSKLGVRDRVRAVLRGLDLGYI